MKKYLLIVLGAILLVGATGCGKKSEVVCTKTTEEGDQKIVEEGVFKLDSDDKVKSAEATYTFNDSQVANSYCELFKMGINEKYTDSIVCSEKKITVKNLEKIAEDSESGTKLTGMSKEELIKFEESEGYDCK